MNKAVIFDMDGVIIDSEPMHMDINYKIFDNLGLDISHEEYDEFKGMSNKRMWSILKERYNIAKQVSELCGIHLDECIKFLKNNNQEPVAGVISLLSSLEYNGFEVGLASSSPVEYINEVLDKFSIKKYFHAIVSGEQITNSKPAPDIFLITAERLNVKPINCIVIEDSKNGVLAAKAADMKCIGYKNINPGCQDLSVSNLTVDNLEDVNINVLNKLLK